MPSREQMVQAIDEYCRCETQKDKDGWLALFADNAKHEDPVGSSNVNIGHAMLAAFWDAFQPLDVELWLTQDVIVCGNEAIALMKARVTRDGARLESGTIVDNFVFDDAGKITNVRAFHEARA